MTAAFVYSAPILLAAAVFTVRVLRPPAYVPRHAKWLQVETTSAGLGDAPTVPLMHPDGISWRA